MTRRLHQLLLTAAMLGAFALAGCATVSGPRAGESPCAFGRRLLDEAQQRLDQARATAELTCAIVAPGTD